MNPKKLSDSTSKGCECWYFSNGNKTGWKLYQYKRTAEMARASQIWTYQKGFAPKILSKIQAFKVTELPRNFYCPVAGRFIIYSTSREEHHYDGKKVNCSNTLKQIMIYGFITQEIDCIAKDIEDDEYGSFCEILNNIVNEYDLPTRDIHDGNWGLLDGDIVWIDFGSHFFDNLSGEIRLKIEELI